jgi:hypothetical protein
MLNKMNKSKFWNIFLSILVLISFLLASWLFIEGQKTLDNFPEKNLTSK